MMLRKKDSMKDVVINWIIMILIIAPLMALNMLGFFWLCDVVLR